MVGMSIACLHPTRRPLRQCLHEIIPVNGGHMIPNYLADVQAAKLKYADAWSHAHVHGDPRRLEWIKLFAKDLHAKDPNCNLNGKRGNRHDLSADAINILCDAADSAGRTPEGQPCVVVDVI